MIFFIIKNGLFIGDIFNRHFNGSQSVESVEWVPFWLIDGRAEKKLII